MTFLQLLKRAHLFLGMGTRAGNTPKAGTVPTTAAGQVDALAELVEWGIMAWTSFQVSEKWGWLHLQGSMPFATGSLIDDSTFDAPPWTLNAWTVSSGVASLAGAATSNLDHTQAAVVGYVYEVTYTVSAYTTGSVNVSFGGASGTARTAAGVYTETLRPTTTAVFRIAGTAFTGSVTAVKLKIVAAAPTGFISNYREWLPFVDRAGRYVLSYVTADGVVNEQRVRFVEYDEFRGRLDAESVTTGRPVFFTIRPDQTWQVYPTPDQDYTLRFDYLCKPKILTSSDDSVNLEDWPSTGAGLPAEFHEAIAWLVVRYWAATRNRPEVYAVADKHFKEQIGPVRTRYLPTARL